MMTPAQLTYASEAIRLLEANPDKINWMYLSGNLNAIHLLESNPDKIDWRHLSLNLNALLSWR